jgi:hypothetical protein
MLPKSGTLHFVLSSSWMILLAGVETFKKEFHVRWHLSLSSRRRLALAAAERKIRDTAYETVDSS